MGARARRRPAAAAAAAAHRITNAKCPLFNPAGIECFGPTASKPQRPLSLIKISTLPALGALGSARRAGTEKYGVPTAPVAGRGPRQGQKKGS